MNKLELERLLEEWPDDEVQIWMIGRRDRVKQTINELYAKRFVLDRLQFSPLIPALFIPGKWMAVLVR